MGRARGPGDGFFPNGDNAPERVPQTRSVPVGEDTNYRKWIEENSFTALTSLEIVDSDNPGEASRKAKEAGQAAPPPEGGSKAERPQYGTIRPVEG